MVHEDDLGILKALRHDGSKLLTMEICIYSTLTVKGKHPSRSWIWCRRSQADQDVTSPYQNSDYRHEMFWRHVSSSFGDA